jgi:hypothetical protein
MHTDPKKNRTQVDHILLDQFRRKGYKCKEVKQQDATILIFTHEKTIKYFNAGYQRNLKRFI